MSTLYKHQRKPLTAAIIPGYSEERNIAGVLEALHASDILDEIIVVDDASTDHTPSIVKQFNVRLIQLETKPKYKAKDN